MDDSAPSDKDGIQPNEWENINLADLTHLNVYVQDNILKSGYPIPFLALNMHWSEPLSPGIPDGR